MRIGSLKKKLRQVIIDKGDVLSTRKKRIGGYRWRVSSRIFDSEGFLPWVWYDQGDTLWVKKRGSVIDAAVIDHSACSDMRKEMIVSESGDEWIAELSIPQYLYVSLEAPYSLKAEGLFLLDTKNCLVTVLETTEASIALASSSRNLLLPPGFVAILSPFALQSSFRGHLKKAIGGKWYDERARSISYLIPEFDTAADLAKYIKCKPSQVSVRYVEESEK